MRTRPRIADGVVLPAFVSVLLVLPAADRSGPSWIFCAVCALAVALAPRLRPRTDRVGQPVAVFTDPLAVATAMLVAGLPPSGRLPAVAAMLALTVAAGAAGAWVHHRQGPAESPWRAMRGAALSACGPLLAALVQSRFHLHAAWVPVGAALWLAAVTRWHASEVPEPSRRNTLRSVERAALLATLPSVAGLTLSSDFPSAPRIGVAMGAVVLALGFAFADSSLAIEPAPRVGRAITALAGGFVGGALPGLDADSPLLAACVGAGLSLATWFALERVDAGRDDARLAEACRRAVLEAAGRDRVADVSAALLSPLRSAVDDLRARCALWVVDTGDAWVVDVAGAVRAAPLPTAAKPVVSWLRARPLEIVFWDVVRAQEVRRPEVRPLVDALASLDAFAAIGMHDGVDLVAVLLLPRGRGRAHPTARDERALRELARLAVPSLTTALSLERARDAAAHAQSLASEAATALAESVRARESESRLLAERGVFEITGSAGTAWIGYGPAMRALDQFLARHATDGGPMGWNAEEGTSLAPLVARLHAHGPEALRAAWVWDASDESPDAARTTLLGERAEDNRERLGLLDRAAGGVLVIDHAQALPPEALTALADALASGSYRPVSGGEPKPLRVQVVLVSRVPAEDRQWPADLVRLLREHEAEIPPLRQRPEDIESLALAAVTRACRIQGRDALGLDRETVTALRERAWLRNDEELEDVLARAVSRARAQRIRVEDLLASEEERNSGERPEDGSYSARERRMLTEALARANGNRSEAARALGLARTTLLDKLRKYAIR